jgi:hypothetical protein
MSKVRRTFLASIGFFLAGAVLFFAALKVGWPQVVDSRAKSQLQVAIRTSDEVEISYLSDPKGHPNAPRCRTKVDALEYAITSTQRLDAGQTKEFLGILEALIFDARGGTMCHDPGFVLRFSREGREILSCSLCLKCSNVELEAFPFVPIWVTIFDRKAEGFSLPQIESFLAKIKPG